MKTNQSIFLNLEKKKLNPKNKNIKKVFSLIFIYNYF